MKATRTNSFAFPLKETSVVVRLDQLPSLTQSTPNPSCKWRMPGPPASGGMALGPWNAAGSCDYLESASAGVITQHQGVMTPFLQDH